MTLTLRAISLNDNPLTQPITANFDADGGSVGRADHNTMALPDPERHISRQHAEIIATPQGYVIKNVGSANPIIVRGQPLARGESAPLGHRDQVRIGGYLLEVVQQASSDDPRNRLVAGRPGGDSLAPMTTSQMRRPRPQPGTGGFGPRTSPGGASAGLSDLNAPLSPNNPFANLLGDPAAPPFTQSPAALPSNPVSNTASPTTSYPPSNLPSNPSSNPRPTSTSPSRNAPKVAGAAAAEAAPGPLTDPFADLMPAAAGVSNFSAAWAPIPPAPIHALLPDDFDPFAMPAPPPLPAARPESAGAGAFEDLIPSAAPASIDEMFGLQGGGRDPLADFMAQAPMHAGSRDAARQGEQVPGFAGLSTDPMAMFGDPVPAAPPRGAPASHADHVPELRASFVPPAVRPEPRTQHLAPTAVQRPRDASAPPARSNAARPQPPAAAPAVMAASTPVAGAWQGDPQALWAALCEGAGVAIDLPQGVDPELMRVVGSVLRSAVAGTLQLMMVRATTKHELGADVTMIRARNNNPLKFSPDARSALEQLLRPPMRGFMPGPAAMTDAMHDLVGHTIGTMAGTRAALEGVLDRFTPQQLEAKLAGKSVVDTLLPMNRKAKLWELYLQHYDAIRNEAQEDFHSLFGRAFLTAYEQQLERLRQDEAGKT